MENTFELDEYDVFDFNVDEVAESVQKIEKNAALFFKIEGIQLKKKLIEKATRQEELKNSGLEFVLTST